MGGHDDGLPHLAAAHDHLLLHGGHVLDGDLGTCVHRARLRTRAWALGFKELGSGWISRKPAPSASPQAPARCGCGLRRNAENCSLRFAMDMKSAKELGAGGWGAQIRASCQGLRFFSVKETLFPEGFNARHDCTCAVRPAMQGEDGAHPGRHVPP